MPLRLLIVEDDASLRRMLHWDFAEQGYEVESVGSCAEARSAWQARRPDRVLLDQQLPDGDGLELLRRFTGQHPALRAVLMSAAMGETLAAQALASGARAALCKPVNVPQIRDHLESKD